MKKPYVKKVLEVAGFKVWLVNGYWIRKNLWEDFTNFAQHYQFKKIPKGEFWIDLEASKKKEIKYYIQTMLMMNSLMAAGMSRKKASKVADEIEKSERAKSKIVQKLEKERQDKEKIIKRVHKKLLKKLSSEKLKIWIVKGDLVRSIFYNDFTQGGHEFVYKFVPKEEVWIDDDIFKKEISYVLIHELHERRLMSLGMKYDPAHEDANAIEFYCRHHPNKIKKRIKLEIKMNSR